MLSEHIFQKSRFCCRNVVVENGHWMSSNCYECWVTEMLLPGAGYKPWTTFQIHGSLFSPNLIDFGWNILLIQLDKESCIKGISFVIRDLIKTLAQSRSFPSACTMWDLDTDVSGLYPAPFTYFQRHEHFHSVWKSYESILVWDLWGFCWIEKKDISARKIHLIYICLWQAGIVLFPCDSSRIDT